MADPHSYWQKILKWTGYYVPTPKGTVPAPLIEGVIYIESRGDPRALNPSGTTRGLGQIDPNGMEYGAFKAVADRLASGKSPSTPEEKAVFDALRPHGGRLTPDLLYDPDVNIAVMTHGINYRSERSGERDWLKLITTGYFGAGPTGDIDWGTTQGQYYAQLRSYIEQKFGKDTVIKLQQGTYPTGRQGESVPGEGPGGETPGGGSRPPVTTLPNTGSGPLDFVQDAVDSIVNAVRSVIEQGLGLAVPFAGRVGLFLAGVALLAAGAWLWL